MRQLNQNFSVMKDKKASAPATLAVFHFAPGDVFVSDRDISMGGGSPDFTGIVTSWGSLSHPSGGPFSVGLPEITLDLANTGDAPFSSHLEGGAVEGVEAELFQWFEGLGYSDKEPIGRFVIASPVSCAETTVRLTLVSAFIKRNRTVGKYISRDAYPQADPDAVGRLENIVYGAPKNITCPAVVAGGRSTLVADITASSASLEVSGNTNEAAFPAAPFTAVCEKEEIRVTSKGASPYKVWTVTRGYNGTTPSAHKKGAAVYEKRSDYTFLAAGHPVKSLGDVYVGGVRVASGVTKNTNASGKATLVFSDKFKLEKSVDLSVDEGSHEHAATKWSGSGTYSGSGDTRTFTPSSTPGWTANQWVDYAFKDSNGNLWLVSANTTAAATIKRLHQTDPPSGTTLGKIFKASVEIVYPNSYDAVYSGIPTPAEIPKLYDTDWESGCKFNADGVIYLQNMGPLPNRGDIAGIKYFLRAGDPTDTNSIFANIYNANKSSALWAPQSELWTGGSSKTLVKTYLVNNSPTFVFNWINMPTYWFKVYCGSGSAGKAWAVGLEIYYVPDTGGASPATGVALSGNSAADIIVGGQVTCDVEGYQDDSSGTFTGTPSALIKNPSDVIRHFMINHMGLPSSEIDASFVSARAALSQAISGGYRFDGVIDRPVDAFDLLEDWLAQARLKLTHDGYRAKLKFVSDAPGSSVKVLSKAVIKKGGLRLARTGKEEVINRLDIHYSRDFSRDGISVRDFQAVLGASQSYPADGDPVSVASFGPRTPARPFLFGFVADALMASDLRDFYITRYKDVKRRAFIALFLDNLELEEGDVLELDYPSAAFSLAGVQFFVERAVLVPGSLTRGRPDEIQLQAREV